MVFSTHVAVIGISGHSPCSISAKTLLNNEE